MKSIILHLACLCTFVIAAQPDTEIILFDLETQPKLTLSNFKNISNNPGYDNQPSFLSESRILYASTRNGQTDISQYFGDYGSKVWINFTEGSEYSPQKVPGENEVSAVRLDMDGKQALYRYNLSNGESTALITDMVVAYYVWANDHTLVSSVIEGEQLNLYVSDVATGSNKKIADNVGRSFHVIPDTEMVSFISKENSNWQIKSLNIENERIRTIANTLDGVEDMCWLNRKTLLAGKGSDLYMLRLQRDTKWKKVTNLSEFGITEISRLSVNISTTKIAMAVTLNSPAESTPKTTENTNQQTNESTEGTAAIEAIVKKQLEAYNKRDIDAYMAAYSEDVKLYNYPNEIFTNGKDQMKQGYAQWFESTPDLNAEILQRIVIGNKVIDETKVTANGQTFVAIAIYEVNNGLITRVTFMQ